VEIHIAGHEVTEGNWLPTLLFERSHVVHVDVGELSEVVFDIADDD